MFVNSLKSRAFSKEKVISLPHNFSGNTIISIDSLLKSLTNPTVQKISVILACKQHIKSDN